VLNYRTDHELRVQPVDVEDARKSDVLWLQQATLPMMEDVVDAFQAHGKAVVYDVDDLLFELPISWPCYGEFFDSGTAHAQGDGVVQAAEEALVYHSRLIDKADVVTVPTPYLAEKVFEHTGRDAWVLPNCVRMSDWDMVEPVGTTLDGPVLGWFGSENHWDDWTEIAGVVDEALEEVGGYLAALGAPYLLTMFPDRLSERTHVSNLVPMHSFGQMRRMIKAFDVGLAWCTDRLEANRCRSPLKAIQYGAAGVPCVASQTVYGENLPGWGDGTRYHDFGVTTTLSDLYDVLVDALTSPREDAAEAWRDEVWRSWSYEMKAMEWLEVIS
jgi:glycosyltransferase involved in cell wall biosynthesis